MNPRWETLVYILVVVGPPRRALLMLSKIDVHVGGPALAGPIRKLLIDARTGGPAWTSHFAKTGFHCNLVSCHVFKFQGGSFVAMLLGQLFTVV